MYSLRPYQAEAKNAVLRNWGNGNKKTLIVMPTGTGKTILFSSITEDRVKDGDRVLILAHRGELLEQAADKLKKASNIDSVLEKAEDTALGSDIPVTVGSVQSMAQDKRLALFPSNYYQDIIIDEAHHCLSETYQRILNHFPNANILGVTATPDRGDMQNLGRFFDSKAYEYELSSAISDGYLVPVTARMIPLELNISNVKVSNGDFVAGEIGDALDPYLEEIAENMKKSCIGRKTVVFLPLISTSQKFCKILNDNGIRAVEVNGNSKDRSEIIADFEAGKYDVLCNSMLLTEGWDCPSVDCVVILRPTRSRSLYCQMVGRGLRPCEGKSDLLLLDFLWLTERHDLCRPSAIISKDESIATKIDEMIMADGDINLVEAEAKAEKSVVEERENALKKALEENRKKKRRDVDPIQFAVSIESEDLLNYHPVFKWETKLPTEKQLDFLERHGVARDGIYNCGYASMLIDKIKKRISANLSTAKQIRCLERYGFNKVGTWSFDDANKLITTLSDNGWRVPKWIKPSKYQPKGEALE